jgi:multiple sugar transport system ATP-binding protein
MKRVKAAVSVRGVSVHYDATQIIERLDLEVVPGEFLVLLGPSGCGKSTLLSAIAGLVELSDGEIWIAERNVTCEEPKDRGIGMVFQSYALYPRMTVEQNLSFGLRVARLPRAVILARVRSAAELLQLTPLLGRRPSQLSGGQRQRVAIGRALVRDAALFLFDEPLSNLDAKLRAELRVEIKRLHQNLGATMIYVTHDQIEALTLADRIAVMHCGAIQQLARPLEVYDRPANKFVAAFIGSPPMNFIEGRFEVEGGVPMFRSDSGTMKLSEYSFQGARPPPGPTVLGLRPEHLRIESENDGLNRLVGRVSVVEPMGPDTIVWAECLGMSVAIRAAAYISVEPGKPVSIGVDLTRASLFDMNTGARL